MYDVWDFEALALALDQHLNHFAQEAYLSSERIYLMISRIWNKPKSSER
jgi:hypothetical protein